MRVKKFVPLAIAALLMIGAAACQLEGEEEAATLPTAGYDTFKIVTDPVGLVQEKDFNGAGTGRIGYLWDNDLDGVGEKFYQINKPYAGIIGLMFGDDGYASGGQPFALAKLYPWQTEYEVPVDILTDWVLGNAALGYRKGEYVDEDNTLVYIDRVKDSEEEALLTGRHETADFRFHNFGVVNADSSKAAPASEGEDQGGDITPSRPGDQSPKCGEYRSFCDAVSDTFVSGWSKADCVNNLYQRNDGNYGTRYNSCLANNCKNAGDVLACAKDCRDQHLQDVFGCAGENAPEVADVLYLVGSGNQVALAEKGITITGDQSLSAYFMYKDAECNLAGGEMIVTVNGAETRFGIPAGVGCNSFEDRALLGFTFPNLPNGEYEFTVAFQDGILDQGVRQLECNKVGPAYTGSFVVDGVSRESNGALATAYLPLDMYEVYKEKLDAYTVGKGFIDTRVVDPQFFVDFPEFDVGFIQGYIWSIANTDDFGEWNFQVLNNSIFTTTQNDRETKFDESDDVQSYAFYIDQPLASGLFTFYGDAGWNLYPKGPSGDNNDQVFVRGAFGDTWMYVPFKPFNPLDPNNRDTKYVGCTFDATTIASKVFDAYPNGLGKNSFDGMSREEFTETIQANPVAPWSACRIQCIKETMAELNGCTDLSDCVDACTDSGKPNPAAPVNLCKYFDPLYVDVTVTVPPEFAASETYAALFQKDEDGEWPLKVGLYAQTNSGQQGVPGGYVDFIPGKTSYRIPFPYFPALPLEFLPINSATSAGQAQIYLTLFDKKGVAYGTPDMPADASHDVPWTYLVLYSYNWVSPTQEGWSLTELEGNSITAFVNPFNVNVPITFGLLGGLGQDDLAP